MLVYDCIPLNKLAPEFSWAEGMLDPMFPIYGLEDCGACGCAALGPGETLATRARPTAFKDSICLAAADASREFEWDTPSYGILWNEEGDMNDC